jgi:predicted  nucleic acid-binding Zn-ribbon protein
VKAELQKLIALQNLDTTIRRLEKEQQAVPERRAEIEGEFDQRALGPWKIVATRQNTHALGSKMRSSNKEAGSNAPNET